MNHSLDTSPDVSLSDVAASMTPDGFIDFYELLGVPGTAPDELIRSRINDLYNKSQANREHRQLAKRREAEVLLDLLPHALNVLGNSENRVRYDAYAVSARAGTVPMFFEEFMNTVIKGTEETERNKATLGTRQTPVTAPATASAKATTSHNAAFDNANATQPVLVAAPAAKPSVALPLGFAALTFIVADVALALPAVATLPATLAVLGGSYLLLQSQWKKSQPLAPPIGNV